MPASILIVDDERSMRDFLRIALQRQGYTVQVASSPPEAQVAVAGTNFDLVVTDLKMPNGSGLDVLDAVKKARPDTQVVVVTAFATTETAIAAMKRGAYDYLTKPFKVEEIAVVVERALEKRALLRDNLELRAQLQHGWREGGLVGKSPAMQQLFELVRKIAPTRTSVLVSGESGTGKELVASALHHLSPRAKAPFVPINCGAIPEALLESELFGHVKGAFTGAVVDKQGLFAAAAGGTIFLDEIGELGPQMQVKLLRVLQERKVKPVGGTTEIEYDVRVVAATNRDLEAEVERGAFRRDLFYRLNVIQLHLPPLRRRREDIPLLIEHFLYKHAATMGRPFIPVDPDALAALCDYHYPGNIRELENLIERGLTLETGGSISRASLPALAPRRASASDVAIPKITADESLPEDGLDLDRVLAEFERNILTKALERTAGARKEAAKLLGISLRSLRYRLAKLGLTTSGDVEAEADASDPEAGSGDVTT